MEQLAENLNRILGLGFSPQDLTLGQLLLRALIVCFVMYVMIRLAGRRFGDVWPSTTTSCGDEHRIRRALVAAAKISGKGIFQKMEMKICIRKTVTTRSKFSRAFYCGVTVSCSENCWSVRR